MNDRRLAIGITLAALTAAVRSYLPIAYVFSPLGGVMLAWREQLIRRIEAALRPLD